MKKQYTAPATEDLRLYLEGKDLAAGINIHSGDTEETGGGTVTDESEWDANRKQNIWGSSENGIWKGQE